jgi:hypothetical protein
MLAEECWGRRLCIFGDAHALSLGGVEFGGINKGSLLSTTPTSMLPPAPSSSAEVEAGAKDSRLGLDEAVSGGLLSPASAAPAFLVAS